MASTLRRAGRDADALDQITTAANLFERLGARGPLIHARVKELDYLLTLGRRDAFDRRLEGIRSLGYTWRHIYIYTFDLGLPEVSALVLDKAEHDPEATAPNKRVHLREQRVLLALHAGDFVAMRTLAKQTMGFPEARAQFPFYPLSAWLQFDELSRNGHPETALANARELSDEAKRTPETEVDALAGEGLVWFSARRWQPAIERFGANWRHPVSQRARSWNATVGAYLGTALVEAGQLDAAIEPLESTIAWHERNSDGFDFTAGMAQLSLARVLWETGTDRPQARLLAERARDAFARLGQHRETERQAAIRWLETHPLP